MKENTELAPCCLSKDIPPPPQSPLCPVICGCFYMTLMIVRTTTRRCFLFRRNDEYVVLGIYSLYSFGSLLHQQFTIYWVLSEELLVASFLPELAHLGVRFILELSGFASSSGLLKNINHAYSDQLPLFGLGLEESTNII